jgi:hypothetical protein
MSAGASGAAAAAAAAEQRRMQEEEEEMTPYQSADLNEDWEFKILRSNFRSFGKPERLAEYLAEEAKAGWVLVEKFDDTRLRLKRPTSARRGDAALGFDPYRTYVGMPPGKFAAAIIAAVLGGTLLVILAVAAIVAALHN